MFHWSLQTIAWLPPKRTHLASTDCVHVCVCISVCINVKFGVVFTVRFLVSHVVIHILWFNFQPYYANSHSITNFCCRGELYLVSDLPCNDRIYGQIDLRPAFSVVYFKADIQGRREITANINIFSRPAYLMYGVFMIASIEKGFLTGCTHTTWDYGESNYAGNGDRFLNIFPSVLFLSISV